MDHSAFPKCTINRGIKRSGLCSWNVLRVIESLVIYGPSYPKGQSTILRVILLLKNIPYHKNVPMIIQTLGSTGYLYLFCSPLFNTSSTLHHTRLNKAHVLLSWYVEHPCDPREALNIYMKDLRV